jgi:UDP-N-acetylmuramoyl-tripeptide--D-alanyl-D-alanine ligase
VKSLLFFPNPFYSVQVAAIPVHAMNIKNLYLLYLKCPNVVTDSRKAVKNSIFFALKGDRFDGNDYALQALAAGCDYAVVDRPDVVKNGQYILVDSVLCALQDLARMHRATFDIPVIAITGTNGKTTTKELLRCVLSSKWNVYATSGNLNNHIGVPLTLLSMPPGTQIAVIEMGASHPGEINDLCHIARPAHGLVTNIGKAHLEGFGGLEGVIRTKKELYDHLDACGGTVFHNQNNPVLTAMLENIHAAKLIGYGNPESSCRGEIIEASPYLQATLRFGAMPYDLETHIAGAYNFENLMAAACIGAYFDVAPQQIVSSLAGYTPQNNRSQVVQAKNNRLLLDYYNANPASMRESLNNFFEHIRGGRMVILGDMFELGDAAPQEHGAIVELLLARPDVTGIVVGEEFYRAAKNMPRIHAFNGMDDLKAWLTAHAPAGQFILIKGSRGMKMEQLADLL